MHDDYRAAAAGLWDRVLSIAESLADEDWQRSTPCSEWDVHDLIAHISAIELLLDGVPDQPQPPEGWTAPTNPLDAATAAGVVARRDWKPAQLLEELRLARQTHLDRLAERDEDAETFGPVGPTTELGLLKTRCFDIWVHLQDLAEALGRPVQVRDDSPGSRLAFENVAAALPYLFGKRAGAPEGATLRVRITDPFPSDQVLAVREGRARFADDVSADDEVEVTPGVLVLLAAGRGTPERWRDEGALQWHGAHAEAFVTKARVFV